MATITIWFEAGEAMMRFPFDRKFIESLKSMFRPGERNWYPEEKLWGVQAGLSKELISLARRHFGNVVVMGDLEPFGNDSSSLRGALLDGLPRPVMEKVYKCIMREVHPDMGGDLETAKRVNVAWDKLRGKL